MFGLQIFNFEHVNVIVQHLLIVRSKIINTIGLKLLNLYQKIVSDAYETSLVFFHKMLSSASQIDNFVSKNG